MIIHFYFTFSILKLSFGILYTASVYSGSLSYYGSHISLQDTSLRFRFQSEYLGFYLYLVIRKSCDVSVRYWKFSNPSLSSSYSHYRKAHFGSRHVEPALLARIRAPHKIPYSCIYWTRRFNDFNFNAKIFPFYLTEWTLKHLIYLLSPIYIQYINEWKI
jgi:hypothetical protein